VRIGRILPPSAAPILWGDFYSALKAEISLGYFNEKVKELECFFGSRYIFFPSSGKAALTLILHALAEMNPDRNEIILPAYTCYSVPSAIKKAGMRIIPCDIDAHSLDYNYDQLRVLSGQRTLCIISCHLFGIPADLQSTRNICYETGAYLVEDAAQSLGVRGEDKLLGTVGDVGFFSLGRGKNITAGWGGIIVTNSSVLGEKINTTVAAVDRRSKTNTAQAIVQTLLMSVFIRPGLFWIPTSIPALRLGETIFYDDFKVTDLPPFNIGLLGNMEHKIKLFNRTRLDNSRFFLTALQLWNGGVNEIPYLRLPLLAPDRETRDRICLRSAEAGLGITSMYPDPINEIREISHLFSEETYPVAKDISRRLFTVPTHQFLTDRDKGRIIEVLYCEGPLHAIPSC
jgi:dTDP-4-amino-4,6-dideoxygalactose transaminase